MVSARVNRNSRCHSSNSPSVRVSPGLPDHVHGQLAEIAMPVGPQQLRHVVLAGLLDVHGGQRVASASPASPSTPGSAARGSADRRRRRCAWPARPDWKAHGRRRSAGPASRRRARRSACPSRPASRHRAGRPPATASVRASSKNTSLNSEVPVIWTIGRTSTPGWSSGTSRYDRPGVPLGALLGAGDHEAPLRQVRQRRPHLLAVDHPLVAVEFGGGRRRWPGRCRRRARNSPGTTAR